MAEKGDGCRSPYRIGEFYLLLFTAAQEVMSWRQVVLAKYV